MINFSIQIIQELENLFRNDKSIYTKLKIIEYYETFLSNNSYHDRSTDIPIEKVISECKTLPQDTITHYKPYRINQIVDAYINSQNSSGFIQPVGKERFLSEFLKNYPCPYMIHLSDEKWTQSLLADFIKEKYNCSINPETIRKKIAHLTKGKDILSHYIKFLTNKITSSEKDIFFLQLYKNPFPIRKIKYTSTDQKNISISGFIYCISKKGFPMYKREPFFQISYNYKKNFLNLDYLFNIPTNSGLFLLEDTPCARELINNYYCYHFKNKVPVPHHEFYLLIEEMYSSCPLHDLMKRFDSITLLLKPILTQYISSIPTEKYDEKKILPGEKLPDVASEIHKLKEIDIFDIIFDYEIKRIPKSKETPSPLLPLNF